jgi:uncharacterized radical SAM superfamily Fe-S cluster-containing enzyme
VTQFALAVLRNLKPDQLPDGLTLWELIKIIDGHNGARLGLAEKSRYNWRIMMIAGMWFQDLFNYDFRRTEMCIIPYGTQVGEVSFCAYNTGVGWRQIVEKMFSTHSTAQWFKEKGRHPIYAAGKHVPLDAAPAPIPAAAIARPAEATPDLVGVGAVAAAPSTRPTEIHAG